MTSLLLDTNGYSALLCGDRKVLATLNDAASLWFSVIVQGELYAGFRAGTKYRQNVEALDRFLAMPSVQFAPVTQDTAEIFGELKAYLKSAGKPIPMNDVWIASQAIEHAAVLLTYDQHFQALPQVRLWEHFTGS